ncbi:MAG: sigma 54-interacting transcriptional regulator [Planctomycetes bacterium]|nr:sigma 54-interacting transcriptional regulator [Planctomycetota bacterium]
MSAYGIQDPATTSAQEFRLLIYRDASVRSVVLRGQRWVVGRAEDCEVRLSDPTVSRQHLVLERLGDEIRFRDVSMTNPVLLNGKPLREGVLKVGDSLVLGLTRVTLWHVRPQAEVRVSDDAAQGELLRRRYLHESGTGVPAPAGGSETADTQVAAEEGLVAPPSPLALLHRIGWSLTERGRPEEVATTLLSMTLDLTGFRTGVLAALEARDQLQVLAAENRLARHEVLDVPVQVLREVRARRDAVLLAPLHTQAEPALRIAVPLGAGPAGLLYLAHPREEPAQPEALLRFADLLGRLIWRRVEEAGETHRVQSEVQRLLFRRTAPYSALLASPRLIPLREELRRMAQHEVPVFLCGEEGTEREELAYLLHSESERSAGPFVVFHPGAIAPERLDEALLGTAPPRARLAETARGPALLRAQTGTLLLEEPERLPAALQERLAHILETGRLQVPGQEPVPLAMRLVCGSALRPGDSVREGRLAPHLGEILGAAVLEVPPLRGNPDDVAALAELILAEMGPAHDDAPRTLSEAARRALLDYSWPGNVRELRRVLEAAAARAGTHPIQPRHLPVEVQRPGANRPGAFPSLEELERQHVLRVLHACGGSKREAARHLGISVSTLYQRLRRYGFPD